MENTTRDMRLFVTKDQAYSVVMEDFSCPRGTIQKKKSAHTNQDTTSTKNQTNKQK